LVITNTFLFLPGIGERRETTLWKNGITHWDHYPQDRAPRGIPPVNHRDHCRLLEQAHQAHTERDLATLARLVPKNEHWRFWREDSPRIGCLDIETTGTHQGARVTVVGVFDPTTDRSHQLVAGEDLDEDILRNLLAEFDLLITFNGNGFDLPVLRHHYPHAVPHTPHIDLRSPLLRLGYRGGLKKIEKDLGILRDDAVEGIDGFEAVRLWRRHERGDKNALGTLLAYNDEDIRNLAPLARFATTVLSNTHAPLLGIPQEPIPWPSGTRPAHLPARLETLIAGPVKQKTVIS
jgi:uncharacterized protein